MYYKRLSFIIPLVAIAIAVAYYFAGGAPDRNNTLWLNIMHSTLMTAGIWLGCSVIVTWLWEKMPWEHAPGKRIVVEVSLIIGYTLLFSYGVFLLERWKNVFDFEKINLGEQIVTTIFITLFITSVHESVFFYKQWKYNFSKSVKLQKDNIEARYETLKSQINPHFLFNSLNSLSNLVGDNDRAVEYIDNLSDFLRYVLQSRDRELVLVRDEVQILSKYIHLQKSRFGDNLQVELNVWEWHYHYSIPPLVLQMLLENCIKHNIVSNEKPLKIKIAVNDDMIHVENVLQRKDAGVSTGQGLRNITERYRFFTDKEVVISENKHSFTVSIPMLTISP